MTNQNCRAADPSTCRFHGPKVYKETKERIRELKKVLQASDDYDKSLAIRKEIFKEETTLDATAVGFKNLTKRFNVALKSGSVEEQVELAIKVKHAAEVRADGEKPTEWSGLINRPTALAQIIIEKSNASTSGKLDVPLLLGSADFGGLYRNLTSEGYEVTDLGVKSFHGGISGTSIEAYKVLALHYLNDEENDPYNVTDIFGGTDLVLRGITVRNKNGDEVKVTGE